MTHECPKTDCQARVRPEMLACKTHWYSLPAALRNAVLDTWKGGRGRGTEAHLAAMSAAVRYLNRGD